MPVNCQISSNSRSKLFKDTSNQSQRQYEPVSTSTDAYHFSGEAFNYESKIRQASSTTRRSSHAENIFKQFSGFEDSKHSTKSCNIIKGYGANTNQGIIRLVIKADSTMKIECQL
jgi:hypothetical protein